MGNLFVKNLSGWLNLVGVKSHCNISIIILNILHPSTLKYLAEKCLESSQVMMVSYDTRVECFCMFCLLRKGLEYGKIEMTYQIQEGWIYKVIIINRKTKDVLLGK